MKLLLAMLTASMALVGTAAHARTFHYACQSSNTDDEYRYALTVNTDQRIVTLLRKSTPHMHATFRIQREATLDECAKYGWMLNSNAKFCTATQGFGTLNWNGEEIACDNADTK
jgi:hypothetical protein